MLESLLGRLNTRFEPRPYAGRGMMRGTLCVGVALDELEDLALLGPELRPGLRVDSFAQRFIAYWPDAVIPVDHELLGDLNKGPGS